jgi:hypothetical protein
MTNELNLELSPEAIDEMQAALCRVLASMNDLFDAFVEAVKIVIEKVRAFAISLARFFLQMQLLEWRVPAPLAKWIAQKMHWVWVVRLGFTWLEKKLQHQPQ